MSDEPKKVSRQRLKQRQLAVEGRCTCCGKMRDGMKQKCHACAEKENARRRKSQKTQVALDEEKPTA